MKGLCCHFIMIYYYMLCLVVFSVGISLNIELNHSIRFIITVTVIRSIYFVVLELCRMKKKVRCEGEENCTDKYCKGNLWVDNHRSQEYY